MCYNRLPRVLVAYQRSFSGVASSCTNPSRGGCISTFPSARQTSLSVSAWRTYPASAASHERSFVAVLPKNEQWSGSRKVKLADIAGEPQLFLGPASATPSVIEAVFRARGLTYSPRFQILQQQTLFSLVEHGMGVALVPDTWVAPYRGDRAGYCGATVHHHFERKRLSPAAERRGGHDRRRALDWPLEKARMPTCMFGHSSALRSIAGRESNVSIMLDVRSRAL